MRSMREYLRMLADYFECYPQQRFGQAAFNLLHDYDRQAADYVNLDEKLDPFYNDGRLTDFFRELEKRWAS